MSEKVYTHAHTNEERKSDDENDQSTKRRLLFRYSIRWENTVDFRRLPMLDEDDDADGNKKYVLMDRNSTDWSEMMNRNHNQDEDVSFLDNQNKSMDHVVNLMSNNKMD